MTRPYIQPHDAPGDPVRYASRKQKKRASNLLGGTVLFEGVPKTIATFERFRERHDGTAPVLHVTVSLPVGTVLGTDAWLKAISVILDELRLRSRLIPWIAWQHPPGDETDCDHAHVVALSQTFAGRPIDMGSRKKRCDEADAALRHHLGLPMPPSPFAVHLPTRRQTNDHRRWIAATIEAAIERDQPTSFEELQTSLKAQGDVDVALTPNSHGVLSYSFTFRQAVSVRGKVIGDALTPKGMDALFRRFAGLRSLRLAVETATVLKALEPHAAEITTKLNRIGNLTDERRKLDDQHLAGRTQAAAVETAGTDPLYRSDRDGDQEGGGGPSGAPETGERGQQRNPGATPDRGVDEAGSDTRKEQPDGREYQRVPGQMERGDGEAGGGLRSATGENRRASEGVAAPRVGLHAALVLPIYQLASKLGCRIARVDICQSTQSIWPIFADGSTVDISAELVRIGTPAKPEAQAIRLAAEFARQAGFDMIGRESGWPFSGPTELGDLFAAEPSMLDAIRAERLRAANVSFLPVDEATHRKVLAQFARFRGAGDEQTEADAEHLVFMTPAIPKQPAPTLQKQIAAIDEIAVDRPGTRVVFPHLDGSKLGSTSLEKLKNRIHLALPDAKTSPGQRPARNAATEERDAQGGLPDENPPVGRRHETEEQPNPDPTEPEPDPDPDPDPDPEESRLDM